MVCAAGMVIEDKIIRCGQKMSSLCDDVGAQNEGEDGHFLVYILGTSST